MNPERRQLIPPCHTSLSGLVQESAARRPSFALQRNVRRQTQTSRSTCAVGSSLRVGSELRCSS